MRVLVVTNMWPSARAPTLGVFVAEQVRALRARGVAVDVLFLGRGKRAYLTGPHRIIGRTMSYDPELVHAHYGLTGAVCAALPQRRPLVVTYHGSDVFLPQQRRWSRLAARRAALNICVSRGVRARLGVADAEVVPCGVDTDLFAPRDRAAARARFGLRTDRKVVLFGGAKANPVKDFALLEAAVARVGLDAQVRTLEGVEREDVPALMSAVDVLALTSRHEGSPMVVKEALACALPVVAVDVGDVREWLTDPAYGRVVPRDPEAVGRALEAVLAQPRPVAPAAEHLPRLASDQVAARIEGLYAEVLARR